MQEEATRTHEPPTHLTDAELTQMQLHGPFVPPRFECMMRLTAAQQRQAAAQQARCLKIYDNEFVHLGGLGGGGLYVSVWSLGCPWPPGVVKKPQKLPNLPNGWGGGVFFHINRSIWNVWKVWVVCGGPEVGTSSYGSEGGPWYGVAKSHQSPQTIQTDGSMLVILGRLCSKFGPFGTFGRFGWFCVPRTLEPMAECAIHSIFCSAASDTDPWRPPRPLAGASASSFRCLGLLNRVPWPPQPGALASSLVLGPPHWCLGLLNRVPWPPHRSGAPPIHGPAQQSLW